MTMRMASISIFIPSCNEILGIRFIAGTIEPSFISGIKALPKKGNKTKAPTNKAVATKTTVLLFCNDKSRSFR